MEEHDDKDDEDPPLLISFLTEFVATGILMWMGCMGCIEFFNIGPVIPAFAFGLAVMSCIQIFSHISPVHMNPAVSVGTLILGKMTPIEFAVYIVAQYAGATAGYGLLWIMMPWTKEQVCLLHINKYLNVEKAFCIEFGATIILMFVVASVSHVKNEEYRDSLPLRVGLVVAGLVFASSPFTGAGLNPARSFPPPLFYNNWKDHWLYEVSPVCGMAFAASIYRFVFDSEEKYSLHSYLRRRCRFCIP